jgi:phosphoribosylformylglycinamidine synthase
MSTAALLDETGRVLGVMPHPERASDPLLGSDDGLQLFAAAARYLGAPAPLESRP